MTERTKKAIETTLQRGETLFADGYTISPTATANVYTVTTPERLNRDTGELYVIDYTVDLIAGTCNCIQFARCGVCKHVRGTRRAVDEARRQKEEARRLWQEANRLLTPQPAGATTSVRRVER